ncbi:protein of unknown function [Methanoculleus bourgensis]|uniref:Uncharacterized protein n=1 Tax=Methanoculleus bourgensis TaxID=83986 RepID=A0A120N6U2_9EURY|nr:protein of unknown function [Methanoculleus bourgensis]
MVRGGRTPYKTGTYRASMEPCLFRHGKIFQQCKDVLGGDVLQWSHVFSDMVSSTNDCVGIKNH